MHPINAYLTQRLQERKQENNYRSLKLLSGKVDFVSNDYLGLARDEKLQNQIRDTLAELKPLGGSTGSRLLSGHSRLAEELEAQLAAFHHAQSALLFNSGFDANYGLLSSLPYRGDTVFYDELCHASIHDGLRASKATSIPFRHNDVADLRAKMIDGRGLKYVVVESLYSMDGDVAPLPALAALCHEMQAGLIVDEAHATGTIGERGEGYISHLGLENKCLARIHTFGKAIGAHGAVVLCNQLLKDFLVNYCRPFIFSTALPAHSLLAVREAYHYLPSLVHRRNTLHSLATLLQSSLPKRENYVLLPSATAIQSIVVKGNGEVKKFCAHLQAAGFDIRPILYPTVARGVERVRICLHSFNTDIEIQNLVTQINNYWTT